MAAVLFCLALLSGRSVPPALSWSVSTRDTEIRVAPEAGALRIAGLGSPASNAEWIGTDDAGSVLPLVREAQDDGRPVSLRWTFEGAHREGRSVALRFRCDAPRLSLTSEWEGRDGVGPVEHRLTVTNRDSRAVVLGGQPSLGMRLTLPAGHRPELWWVEKSAGGPSDRGAHRAALGPGARTRLRSTPYSEDGDRDAIPWLSLHDPVARRGLYAGIEFSGRVGLDVATDEADRVSLGGGLLLPTRSRLAPGETFAAPAVFVGCYEGSVDDGSNRMRQWLREAVCPPVRDPRYPLLTLNSWGSGMAIDAALARRMSRAAADLGLEMFHVDAGWFRQVGDWRPDPRKFPQGLRAVSDEVHALGLKFGLWVGWTQAGVADEREDPGAILDAFSPTRRDWIAEPPPPPPGWKPQDFIGTDVCLSVPAAQTWCEALLDRLVREFRVDMLEHDQRMVVQTCVHPDHSHTDAPSDIAYRAAEGYYAVYDAVRRAHPDLLLEDCVNGGRMVDYGVLRRANYVSISDTYTPVPNRQAFYDNSFALPAAACECYVSDREPPHSLPEFVSMLRSGMMGWFTLMQDPSRWSPDELRAAKRQFDLYKSKLRPLILDGDLYHASERPDGVRWDGIQYASRDRGHAVLFAFRGTTAEAEHPFPLHGLDPEARYRVAFEDAGLPPQERTGADLLRFGVAVRLAAPKTSEIVLLDRL